MRLILLTVLVRGLMAVFTPAWVELAPPGAESAFLAETAQQLAEGAPLPADAEEAPQSPRVGMQWEDDVLHEQPPLVLPAFRVAVPWLVVHPPEEPHLERLDPPPEPARA